MTSIAGFFSKKQYAAMADRELAMKLLKERCKGGKTKRINMWLA